MNRKVLLVEIGGQGLPEVTPVGRQPLNWVAPAKPAVVVPPAEGVETKPAADSVTITWNASPLPGAVYVLWRAADAGGKPGDWKFVTKTLDTRYTYTEASGVVSWWKVTVQVNGVSSADSTPKAQAPVVPPTTAELVQLQKKVDQGLLDLALADAAEARERRSDIAAVNASLAQETAFRVAALQKQADDIAATNQQLAREKLERANDILNEKLEREAAVDSLSTATQTQFDSVAQQIASVAAGSGTQFDSAKIWLFNTTTESWTSNGTPTVVDGMFRPANGTTTNAQSPAPLAIDSNAYRFIKTRIKRVGNPPWRGQVRWITDANQSWDDAKSVTIPVPSFDANGIATVDISDIPWNGASPIRAIRMALVTVQTATDYLMYDYVAIGRPSPGASVALVQEVQTALQQADQVVAQSVTTLGVQMRGQYTGTDPAQLTSGLMYQEMQARVTADLAQVQRIFTMEGRMPTGSGVLASEARVMALEQATTTTTNSLAQSITTINATLPAMIAQGSNMVLNGGWQSGRDVGWTYNNATLVVAANEGRAGGAALRADGWNGGARHASVNGGTAIAVSPGKKYRYGCWYRTSADFNGTPGNSKLRLANQSGALIGGATYFVAAKDQYTYVGAVYTVPDNTSITGLQLSVVVDNTAGTVWVDDVVLEEVTDVIANAEGLQALTTTVNNQGGQISSQAGLISALRTDVDGKASNAAMQSLQSQVTLQGSDITSLGTAMTNVTASLGSVGSDNQLANSSFEDGTSPASMPGWLNNSAGMTGYTSRRLYAPSQLPNSTRAWRWELDSVPTTSYLEAYSSSTGKVAKVIAGQPVSLSAFVRGNANARWYLQVAWRDSANGVISYYGTSGVQNFTDENWARRVLTSNNAPANAVTASAYLRVYGANVAGQWVEWDNVQLEVSSVASGYKPSIEELQLQTTANASATTALTGTVTSLQGIVTALGQSVTTVNARLDSIGGDNLLPNSSFENSTSITTIPTEWNLEQIGGLTVAISYVDSPLSGGGRAVRLDATTTANGQWFGVNNRDAGGGSNLPRIRPNTDYVLSSYVRGTAGCTVQVIAQFRNAQNGVVNTVYVPTTTLTGNWQRLVVPVKTTGATADRVRIYVGRIITPTPQAAFIEVDNVMLQEGLVATQWIPSTTELSAKVDANAAATNTLTGTVTNLQGQVTAQGTSITSVNANIDQLKQQGSNAVLDGSFENRAVNQGVGVGFVTADAARSGTKSLKIVANGAIRDVSVAIFDNPGDNRVWYAEVWVRNAPGAAVTTGNIQLAATCTLANGGSNYPQFKALAAASVTDSWQKLFGYITVPATTTRLQIRLSIRDNVPSGAVLWDDVYAEDVTDSYNAAQTAQGAASGVSALQAVVTQQGQDIIAQANKMDGVQSSIDGKADASAMVELATRVANQSGAGNKLSASTFADAVGGTTTGWFLEADTSGAQQKSGYIQGDSDAGVPTGMRALIITKGGTSNGTGALIWRNTGDIPVEPGKTYIASVYASGTSGVAFVWVTGGGMEAASVYANKGGGNKLSDYDRVFVKFTAPANVRAVGFRLAMHPKAADGQQFARFVRPMFEEVSPDQNEPSPWSAGGQESFAGISMFTNVDGHISGIQNKNNGSTSELNFLATAVNILTPGGADGFEMTKGYLRVWAGNSQRIIGNNFGADGLVDYFGPNVGAANANKTNATMWMDRDGNAYWGGAIAAGNLRNAMQSTSIQTIGNGVLVGPFDTNGRNKQVVVGYNRRHTRIRNGGGPDGFVAGAGSNGGVINLYRQLNGQGETLWQQIPIGGRVDIFNEPDANDRAVSYWSASVTLNDSSDGATRRSYRAEIVSYSEQSVTHQSGSFTSQTITQSLSIVSIE